MGGYEPPFKPDQMKTKILGYDEDGCPMYALSTKQTIVTYVLLAFGLILFSGVVVWMLS